MGALHRHRHFRTEVMPLPGQPLVASGIYRFVRHPSETGLLAASLGACVLLGSGAAFVVWFVALLPLVVVRIRLEERLLSQAFGGAFERYRRRTRMLLPYVL